MSKDRPVHGLEKIPDSVVIQQLRVELGQANSYIDELKYKVAKCASKKSSVGRIKHLESQLKTANKKILDYQQRMRVGSGNVGEFEQWCIDNSIDAEQKQKLIFIIKHA